MRKSRWKYLELRGGKSFFDRLLTPSSWYYGHVLHLTPDHEGVFSRFRSSTRRNIAKAIRHGVETKISSSPDSLKEFYRLHCVTRKHHGLPPQTFGFFRTIHQNVLSDNQGFIVSAYYNNKAIASAIYFHLGQRAIYKYGASDRRYQHLRANNLVMWTAIRWCAENGCKRFSFGRTEKENLGLLQFKNGWNTEKQILNYYKYDLKREKMVKEKWNGLSVCCPLFKKTPVSFLKCLGGLVYKHAG